MAEPISDVGLLEVDEQSLLAALRSTGVGTALPPSDRAVLVSAGLIGSADPPTLTEAGAALYRLAWVHRNRAEAMQALGNALRGLNLVQVIEQEMRGFGSLPEAGVLDLLLFHRAVPLDTSIEALRRLLRWMNRIGVVVYSTKFKTVKAVVPPEDAALHGEDRRLAAMVSPRTPYSNLVRLRRILRSLSGTVWWVDPHFGHRALEELAEELDPE
ncbi:hypothetical protein B7486_69550, partial [cyanobacterium TDX16]